jgi:hypothetical protein
MKKLNLEKETLEFQTAVKRIDYRKGNEKNKMEETLKQMDL